MRRIPAALAVLAMLFAFSACGKTRDVTEYLSLPFSCEAKITADSSEYLASVEKGGANLVSVRINYPESLSGMTLSLGEENEIAFRGSKALRGFPYSLAELISDAFNDAKRIESFSDGDCRIVRFASRRGVGIIKVDGFSAVPVSLESDGVYIEFNDFKR